MQQATVTAKYVNPPKGKGPASIKDNDGRYWKFWTRDVPLDSFQIGGTYTVGYKTEQYNGEDQYYIEAVVGGATPASAPARQASPPASPGRGEQIPQNGQSRDKHIFVCGVVNNAIAAGKLDPMSAVDMGNVLKVAASVYDAWHQ